MWSDEWTAYNQLNALGYIHQTVNHSQHCGSGHWCSYRLLITVNTVDPATGVHIHQTVNHSQHCGSGHWRSYRLLITVNTVGPATGVHQTVNHSQHCGSGHSTGVHTNYIKARWSACKASFKRRSGISEEHLPSYIDE